MKKTILSLRFDHSVAFLTITEMGKKSNQLLDAISLRLSKPFTLEFLEENKQAFINDVGNNISEFIQDITEIHLSYSMQSSILKTVHIDPLADKELNNTQIRWEFSQITQIPITEYVINLPEHYSEEHHTIVAMRRKLVSFSFDLAESLELELTKIGLNLTNLTQLIPTQRDFDEHENYLVINRGRILTEIGAFHDGMFQKTHLISAQDSGNINQLNLQMRNILDTYKASYREVLFDRIYVCGSATDSSEQEMIANVLKIPVTILMIPSNFKFNDNVAILEEDISNQSEYIINISSLIE